MQPQIRCFWRVLAASVCIYKVLTRIHLNDVPNVGIISHVSLSASAESLKQPFAGDRYSFSLLFAAEIV